MKRLFFFWLMYPLDWLADVLQEFHIARPFDDATFGYNAPGPRSQREPLSFSQIAWADKHLRHFESMRKQAEAARGAK